MGQRRADSDGEGGNFNKKSNEISEKGRNAYDFPSNRTLQGEGYGWNRYGDEVGIIGQKELRREKGKDKGKGKTREKEKGNRKATTKEQ